MADSSTPIHSFEIRLAAFDGLPLAAQVWEPQQPIQPGVPVAVSHHGVASYGVHHETLGRFLAERGIPLVALDARGHGRSGGERGEMRSGRTVLLDLHTVVCWMRRRHPGHPLLLIGESMGGLFGLTYVSAFAPEARLVDALWVLAPGLMIQPRQLADFTVVRHTPMARRAALEAGRTSGTSIIGSRDAAWLARYQADPLVLGKLHSSYFIIIVGMWFRLTTVARRWTAPTLIMHGKRDPVVPYQGSVVLYNLLGSKDKELVLYPQAWHTLFSDPDTPQVLAHMDAWLRARYILPEKES
jgi:alpha-beta hydrolase superfamily lysophospholipase